MCSKDEEVDGKNQGHTYKSSGFCTKYSRKIIMAIIVSVCVVVLVAGLTPVWASVGEDTSSHSGLPHSEPIRVGAFNVQQFGKTFMTDEKLVANLLKILTRYDIVLIQEVRDSSHNALNDLKNHLNAMGEPWTFDSSAPLGRSTSYREQYVFFYNKQSVKYSASYQVNDSQSDIYEREPYAIEFEYPSVSQKSNQRVVLMALHAKPKSVKEELEQLPVSIRTVADYFSNARGVVALGDFNADCSYLSAKARKSLELFTSKDFRSLIPDDADTTVSQNTNCAYDRVVVYGKIDARQGSVYNFEMALNLDADTAADLSDHYPAEFLLY